MEGGSIKSALISQLDPRNMRRDCSTPQMFNHGDFPADNTYDGSFISLNARLLDG